MSKAGKPTPLVLGDGTSPAFAGSFRKNLKDFFRLHGEKVSFAQMKHSWANMVQVKYKARDGSSTDLKLHFYTELVRPEFQNVACDECRIMGCHGSIYAVSNVEYQGLRILLFKPGIPVSEKTLANPRTLMSLMEMRHRGWMHRARLDASKIQREKEEDYGDGTSEFVAAENMFYSKSHLLHGVFHMNGFGHLCRVNGREGGSSMYSGTELMRVWDELCCILRMRMVSVEDVSNKLTMELRILLPLAYGNTWYGRWGYEFGRSPFNVQADQWHVAVQSASSVRIADLIDACSQVTNGQMKPRRGWKAILAVLQRYHNAPLLTGKPSAASTADQGIKEEECSCPEDNLVSTVGDLLRAMLDALRSPSEAWFTLLVGKGACAQRPETKELAPELKGSQIKESALLAAFNAQLAPPIQAQCSAEDLYVPEPAKKKKAQSKNGATPAPVVAKSGGKRAKNGSAPGGAASAKVEPIKAESVKKAPKIKIRKRPRSASTPAVAKAEPAATVPPVGSSQPTEVAEIAALSQPVAAAEVAVLSEPMDTDEPASAELPQHLDAIVPAVAVEPVVLEPATAVQPASTAEPVGTAQPVAKAEPTATAGPVAAPQPTATAEPVANAELPDNAEPAAVSEPVPVAPPLSSADLLPSQAVVGPFPEVEEGPDYNEQVFVTARSVDSAQLGNCDTDDPGPVKKQARGDVTTPPTISLVAADAFAQPSSLDKGSKEDQLANEGNGAPILDQCMADLGARSKRSRQPSVRLARFEERFPEKKEKPPRRASASARHCHDDATWMPSTSGAVPVKANKLPERALSKSPGKAKTSKAAAEGKALRSSAEAKASKGTVASKAPKSGASKSPAARSPAGKSAGTKSPAGKAPAVKAPAVKAPAAKAAAAKAAAGKAAVVKSPASKAAMVKALAGKSPVGLSPAGKAGSGRLSAGKSPAKGKGGKSPACGLGSPEKKSLKRPAVTAAAAAPAAAPPPPPNAENAPSEAMKLWCRNVDRLVPGGTIHASCATASTLKNQIMADLICLFFTLFRTDVSENLNIHYELLPNITAHSGVNLTKPPPPSPNEAVAQLRDAVSTLRYTKHFVKDYSGELPAAGRGVKNSQSKAGKKKAPAGGTAECRVLVTVLMGYSFEAFGGPDAVEEGVEKETNGKAGGAETNGKAGGKEANSKAGGTEKRARPRSHRLRLATEAGVWPAETVSTQPADTDEAEVALKSLRISPCCGDDPQPAVTGPEGDDPQPAVTGPAALTDCEAAGDCEAPGTNSAGPHNSGACSQQLPADDAAVGAVDAAACADTCDAAAHDTEARDCTSNPAWAPDEDVVQDQCMHDAVMSPNAGDTAASEDGDPMLTETKEGIANPEEPQAETDGAEAVVGPEVEAEVEPEMELEVDPEVDPEVEPEVFPEVEPEMELVVAQDGPECCEAPAADGATDTANSEHTEAVTSPEAGRAFGASAPEAVCTGDMGSCGVERRNSSSPAELDQHAAAAVDQADVECKHEECTANTGSREQPCDTACCDAAGASDLDGKGEAVGDIPDCRQRVGDLSAAIEFSHSGELHAALHDPAALPPRLRPPPAELLTFQPSTTVGDFKKQIAAALKETYQIFAKFRVDWLHCPSLCKIEPTAQDGDVSRPFYFGTNAPDKAKIESYLELSPTEPVHVVVAGPGLDLGDEKLRHAGGEADWVVACHCGVTDDDGERMLCCDKCGRWVHSHCEGIADSQPDPTKFTCRQCYLKSQAEFACLAGP